MCVCCWVFWSFLCLLGRVFLCVWVLVGFFLLLFIVVGVCFVCCFLLFFINK